MNKGNIIGAVVIIALVVVGVFVGIYIIQNNPKDNNKQKTSGIPQLVSEPNLSYTDNRTSANSPFLQITGTIKNVGNATANNCVIHVAAFQAGNVTAIDANATIPSLGAGLPENITLEFPYTGQALETFTSYLTWTNGS